MAWRNDTNLYSRKCDLCGKNIVSLYSQDKPFPVYCNKCWWSDRWDAKEYGGDFDFSRPFFEQFKELQNKVPALALVNDNDIASVNCEYTHDFAFGKNCYMVIVAWRLEDSFYSYGIDYVKDVGDCLIILDKSERLYEAIFVDKCYNSKYIYNSSALQNCAFCYDCRDSSDCFLSHGLRHKKYHIKNRQYSRSEYEKILASYRLDTYSGVMKAKEEFRELILKFPRKFAVMRNCVNSTGDYLWNSKNSKYCFNAKRLEDCRYCEINDSPKDSYDLLVGGEAQQCYEGITPDQSTKALFTVYSWKNLDVTYTDSCHSSQNLFGCVGLKKTQRCILNKQYTKEDYDMLKGKIVKHMKETKEWGEFFPIHLSPFGYNETTAQDNFPLAREETLRKGFKWQDNLQLTAREETIQPENLPDGIDGVSDSIIQETLKCVNCQRNYRIIKPELEFYRKMKVPIPRECFYCRHRERLRLHNPARLWQRKCQCAGGESTNKVYKNISIHFHQDKPCPHEFQTSYAPERPETVYCERCYQSEIG